MGIQIIRLFLRQINIQISNGKHTLQKCLQADFHISIDIYAEIFLNRCIQQFHSAVGIGGIQLIVTVAGD